MMTIRTKGYLLYFLILTWVTFIGTFYMEEFVQVKPDFIFNKIIFMILILLNAAFIYQILLKHSQVKSHALLIATLYVVSPLHLDVFYLPFEGQFLLSETFLILSLFFYYQNKTWNCITFIILAALFNLKLLGLLLLLLIIKGFTTKQKIIIAASFVVILSYLLPGIIQQSPYYFDNFKSLVYIVESIVSPFNLTIFSKAVLVSNYYSFSTLFVFTLISAVLTGWYLYKRHIFSGIILLLVISSGLSVFLPVKYLTNYETHFYYFTPSLSPNFLFIFLLLSFVLIRKFNSKVIFGTFIGMALLWFSITLNQESMLLSKVSAWQRGVGQLPERLQYDEYVKYNFVKVLLEANQFDLAEKIIVPAKARYAHERWFYTHVRVASSRGDNGLLKLIYEERATQKMRTVLNANELDLP